MATRRVLHRRDLGSQVSIAYTHILLLEQLQLRVEPVEFLLDVLLGQFRTVDAERGVRAGVLGVSRSGLSQELGSLTFGDHSGTFVAFVTSL